MWECVCDLHQLIIGQLIDWLIDWLRISMQQCEGWNALLSPALPALLETSAPGSAPHTDFRSHAESICVMALSAAYVLQLRQQRRGNSGFSWLTEGSGQRTTWICLRKCVSCFRTLIASPDTKSVLFYTLLWTGSLEGGSYCCDLCR